MAVYTPKILKTCKTGEHIDIGLFRDGIQIVKMSTTRTYMKEAEVDMLEIMIGLLRLSVKESNPKDELATKTCMDAVEVRI